MKKDYSSPILEYQKLVAIDILTASGDTLVDNDSVWNWEEGSVE